MGENTFNFYANSVNIVTSYYDVLLRFRTQSPELPIKSGEQLLMEDSEVCNIRMSPQHAKSVAALLVKQIVEYERDNDIELPIPSDIQKFWNQYVNPTKEGE